MESYYTQYFNVANMGNGSNAFDSLYRFVYVAGGGAYRIVFISAVLMMLTFMILTFIDYFWSTGRSRDEAKRKLIRNIWVAIGVGCMSSALALIFKMFAWP